MPSPVAILSLTCRFPDAVNPDSLWANVAAGRRSFRPLPRERLDLVRYAENHVGAADSITPIRAGLLTDWSIDRARFRIPQKTFDATDLTHWLALDLASEAIAAAGGIDILNRSRTAVVVANTLTGEFSRASLLRLRAPFLDDVLADAAKIEHVDIDLGARLRATFRAELCRHFPDPNEDSLAGGLANTIAGRIANYFDLRGGAYSVDAACASSLVALADGANLLTSGQVDSVLVAAVDLSLDPFELVGFSRNGALATGEMRVFDRRANGFWPGEGGGCVLLMRQQDAVRAGRPVLATLQGWGLSSDGAGGMTRPSTEGQIAACRNAYTMADIDPNDVAFVEAHGTGTAVGDPIEVRALAQLRDAARASLPIGSIKGNIGHTKAAAGFAGLVKTIEALRRGLIPPHVGCDDPHPVFDETDNRCRPVTACERLVSESPAIAGVSGFGFGGINAHVVLQCEEPQRRYALPAAPRSQDSELFLFAGQDTTELGAKLVALEQRAPTLSIAEFSDAAAAITSKTPSGPVRIAIVAANGLELARRLAHARSACADATPTKPEDGIFIGRASRQPRVGFLFPGQSAPSRPDGGAWQQRFSNVAALTAKLPQASDRDSSETAIAQPSIVAASLAGIEVLKNLGVTAAIAAGHSLGELTALIWAGVLDSNTGLDLTLARGSIMARHGIAGGTMLRVALRRQDAMRLASETDTVIACHNGVRDFVLAGDAGAIANARARCDAIGAETSMLAVSHAFHSNHMLSAVSPFADVIEPLALRPISSHRLASTITGALLTAEDDPKALLVRQLVQPVLFDDACALIAAQSDIVIEVGPGEGLTRLMRESGIPCYTIDAFGASMKPLLTAAGALFAAGYDIDTASLFAGRDSRPFNWTVPKFISGPCGVDRPRDDTGGVPAASRIVDHSMALAKADDPLAAVLAAIAGETGSPADQIGIDEHFLDQLHLNSLSVTRIVLAASRALATVTPSAPTEFANATPRILADALAELRLFGKMSGTTASRIVGVRPWIANYATAWHRSTVPRALGLRAWRTVRLSATSPAVLEAASVVSQSAENAALIWIDDPLDAACVLSLFEHVATFAREGFRHLAICHRDAALSAFARSVFREGYFQSVRLIDCAASCDDDQQIASLLTAIDTGYQEIRLAADGEVCEPVFAPTEPVFKTEAAITASDVVVIIGGGKGIAAECAIELGRSGAAIVLVGRSPVDDPAVAATLKRAAIGGGRCRYVSADVTLPGTLQSALAPALLDFGPATALVYAPAINQPKRLIDLDAATLRDTIAIKTTGLENAITALGPTLKRLITFGSIIGRIGLEGETHYALANAMQSAATELWGRSAPGRTSLAIEWSVWGAIGMGERLGTLERLESQGVDALSVDHALAEFLRLTTLGACGIVAVTGRFGPPADLDIGVGELPMLRFVDQVRVNFPNVELVVDTAIDPGRDLYHDDHVIDGHAILPATVGLEAMAQAVHALADLPARVVVKNVTFERALAVPAGDSAPIQIAVLRVGPDTIDAQISSSAGGAPVVCMRATFGMGPIMEPRSLQTTDADAGFSALPLYGPLFFHGATFQSIDRLTMPTSRRVAGRLALKSDTCWFGPYESKALALWDPGVADAVLHALLVAIPHRRVLPIGVDRIEITRSDDSPRYFRAVERSVAGSVYTFDITVTDSKGFVVQRWINAAFRAVGATPVQPVLAASPWLTSAYVERAVRDLLPDQDVTMTVVRDAVQSRTERRAIALSNLGLSGGVERRGDGKPVMLDNARSISIAHGDEVTIAITARGPVGCDIEKLEPRSDVPAIRRHSVAEACRKLGRRVPSAVIPAFELSTLARIGDITVLMLDVEPYCLTVAFLETAAEPELAEPLPPFIEVAR